MSERRSLPAPSWRRAAPCSAAIAGAALAGGAGGLIGSVLAKWLGDHHAHHLQEQIERGGLLLWVRTRDPAREERAIDILGKYSAEKVHVHGLPLEAQGREAVGVGASQDRS